MKRIEWLFNRYFNNILDKVTLGIILIYGFLVISLSVLTMIGEDTILKYIVKNVSKDMGFYMCWTIFIIPIIRFSQIVNEKNVFEDIIPKSYRDKFISMIKKYAVMYFVFILLKIISSIIIPIVDNEFGSVREVVFVISGHILLICFTIGLVLYSICGSIIKNNGKFKLGICLFIVGYGLYMSNFYSLMGVFNRSEVSEIEIRFGSSIIISPLFLPVLIVVDIILIFVFQKFILNNINKINKKKLI